MTAQYNNLTGEGAKTGVSEFHDVFIFVPEETYGPRSTTVYTIDTRGRITNQVTSETQGGGN